MTKYDYGFKRLVVKDYQNDEGEHRTLARHFGIPADSTVNKQVKTIEQLGFITLNRRKGKQTYSSQFKQDIIHYYLTSSDSYLDVALNYGLPSGNLLQHWHQVFLREGMEDLSPKGKTSITKKKKMNTPKKPSFL